MAEQFQLNPDGTCKSCNTVTVATENLKCLMCKEMFHGACPNTSEDERVGTKSLIGCFNRPSTKRNFQFLCDPCLTKMENSMAGSDANRLNTLENNLSNINAELTEIKNLLAKQTGKPPPVVKQKGSENIWFNKDKLASMKAAPAESMLIINNICEADNDSVEKAIVDNAIPVTKSFKNNDGGLVLICETTDTRDKLKDIIASTNEDIQLKAVLKKKPSITIVGLNKCYTKKEITNQLVNQNQFVKHFSMANNINEHIEIHNVKPTRSNTSVYQVFASVSEVLRKGLRNYKDKVVIGLTNCKIYDRFHIKRCNNCHGHGHYYKDCPTPNVHSCAKCSLEHPTNTCSVTDMKSRTSNQHVQCYCCSVTDMKSRTSNQYVQCY